MDIRKLQRAIVDGLEDVKAQNIAVFNTEQLTPLFERVIIASGTSNRQTKALAASVRDAVKASGFPVMRTEGEDNGEWIIVDCGAAVAHIMQPAIRDYYHLEEIWGSKPVRVKLEGAVPLPKAGATAKKAPAKQATAKEPAARRPAAKAPAKRAAPAKAGPAKAPARKTAAAGSRSGGAARPAPTRTVGVKGTAAAKKAPARAPRGVLRG